MCCVYTMEYYSDIKKEIMLWATTCIELEGIMLSEISDRVRQMSYDFSYM